MTTFFTVVHITTCFFVVVVVLMQSGKGAEISATLGGSSQTVFGSTGGANFFQKITYVLAAVFMTTSLVLTILGNRGQTSVFDRGGVAAPAAATSTTAPVAPPPGEIAPTTTTAPAAAPATK